MEMLGKLQNYIYYSGSLTCQGHFREEDRYGGGRYFDLPRVTICPETIMETIRPTLRFQDAILKSLTICPLESVSVHPVYGNPQTGLLRTFWEPRRVLRSPLRGLCVQGALSCPARRAFLCTLYTENPERAF